MSAQQAEQYTSVIEVTPPKVRLFLDAPQPLHGQPLHQPRRTFHRAGLKIHDCAQVHAYRHLQALVVAEKPGLPLPRTQRGNEKLGTACVDARDDVVATHVLDGAETWTQRADAMKAGRLGIQRPARRSCDALLAAEEKDLQRLCWPLRP